MNISLRFSTEVNDQIAKILMEMMVNRQPITKQAFSKIVNDFGDIYLTDLEVDTTNVSRKEDEITFTKK